MGTRSFLGYFAKESLARIHFYNHRPCTDYDSQLSEQSCAKETEQSTKMKAENTAGEEEVVLTQGSYPGGNVAFASYRYIPLIYGNTILLWCQFASTTLIVLPDCHWTMSALMPLKIEADQEGAQYSAHVRKSKG